MAVRSMLSSFSDMASGAVDAPVRGIVEAVLNERGFVDASTFDTARRRLEGLEAKVAGLMPRVEAAEQRAQHLADEVKRLQSTIDDLTSDLADARTQTMQAVARADEAEAATAKLAAELDAAKAAKPAASVDERPTVGDNGEVEVRGKAFFVAAEHAGKPYTVAHNGAVRVGRRLVKKTPQPQS